jgi:hypothetical protein
MTMLESTTRGSTDPTRIETADGANHSHHGFDPIKASLDSHAKVWT